jgi:transposase/DNA invertase Pin-like site-specific DNA recombinase
VKSGKSKWRRVGLKAALDYVRNNPVDLFIVEQFERFARSVADGTDMYRTLKHYGVELISLHQGKATLHSLTQSLVEAENQLTTMTYKIQEAIRINFQEGKFDGYVRFGYRNQVDYAGERIPGKLEIDPATAPHIQWMFDELIAGMVPGLIAERSNERGIFRLGGGKWETEHVVNHLRCEKYMGWTTWDKTRTRENPETGELERSENETWYIREAPHLKIVEREAWELAQTILDALSTKPASARRQSTHLLAGLLKCPECGSVMHRAGKTMIDNERCGEQRFKCSKFVETRALDASDPEKCSNSRPVNGDLVQDAILEDVCNQLDGPEPFQSFMDCYLQSSRRDRQEIDAQKRNAERAIQLNLDRIELYDQAMFNKKLDVEYAGAKINALLDHNRSLEDYLEQLSNEQPLLRFQARKLATYRSVAHAIRKCFPRQPTTDEEIHAVETLRNLLGDVVVHLDPNSRNFRLQYRLFVAVLVDDTRALSDAEDSGWETLTKEVRVPPFAQSAIARRKRDGETITEDIPGLSDEEWSIIAPVLNRNNRKSIRLLEVDRRLVGEIFYKFRTGIRFVDLPNEGTECLRRFRRWHERGVWQDVFRELEQKLPESLDGFNHMAFESWFETDELRIHTVRQILSQKGQPMTQRELWMAMIDRGVWPARCEGSKHTFQRLLQSYPTYVISLPPYGHWLPEVPLKAGDVRRQVRREAIISRDPVKAALNGEKRRKPQTKRTPNFDKRSYVSDAEWMMVEPILPPSRAPSCLETPDNRTVISGVFYLLRFRKQWSDLPRFFGNWRLIYMRFYHWRRSGYIQRILEVLSEKSPHSVAEVDVSFLFQNRRFGPAFGQKYIADMSAMRPSNGSVSNSERRI